MLEIKKVVKVYKTGKIAQKALNDVSVNFRDCEFASILGPSGSGKTTFLNIIGGLDHYTHGDLIISGLSTKKFKSADWDSYRNHRVGFIFQSYNLIPHQTILSNVRLALTLSGISKKEANKRAKKALEEVGLGKHINKRPNQLSGGQMQRVAIARALVNNPEILLADEPTGALDSETSLQIMELLKKIAETRLVIMVTHNPELAQEYSSRIITLKDGKIIDDTNPYDGEQESSAKIIKRKDKKTKMAPGMSLGLSFSNLMTKKARTLLVAFAGSIGIIGIALILAISNGFQRYVDDIEKDTLTSYPLMIEKETADLTSALLSAAVDKGDGENQDNSVKEKPLIANMLSSLSVNDLADFKKYLDGKSEKFKEEKTRVEYKYSVEPMIYTDVKGAGIRKINPSEMFASIYSGSSALGNYSSYTSVFSAASDEEISKLSDQYDMLAGKLPEKYNEMVLILNNKDSISDYLLYSLGLRDPDELAEMVRKIMNGQVVEVDNEPITMSYEDLMNVELKLIQPSDLYRYNSEYDVYEDLSENEEYLQKTYDNGLKLKIVGVMTAKEDADTFSFGKSGVLYSADLIDHVINYAKQSGIVKKQLANMEVNVVSGKRFDDKSEGLGLNFADFVSVDEAALAEAFGGKIDKNVIAKRTQQYMQEIAASITADITPEKEAIEAKLNQMFDEVDADETAINKYKDDQVYFGILSGYLQAKDAGTTREDYLASASVIGTIQMMAQKITEMKMQQNVLGKVGQLTTELTESFANAFNVDTEKIAGAFRLSMTEEEITRIITAMLTKNEVTAESNLISFGYQDKEDPTAVYIYFDTFENKENFLKLIDEYNGSVEEEKQIKYSDATGILMSSVKTIVNAVTYVLIGFVSISLVVSSIMIGVITYISVYERTKEIGILRALGASKRNISSIFNAETFIIGLLSGGLAIGFASLAIPIINAVIYNLTGIGNLKAFLSGENMAILMILSVGLTIIGGLIPAKSASKKDPVEALRYE